MLLNLKSPLLYSETPERLLIAIDKHAMKGTVKEFLNQASTSLETAASNSDFGAESDRGFRETDRVTFIADISEKGKCRSEECIELDDTVQDDMYYFDMLEDAVFLVPKYRFTQETDAFCVMFNCAKRDADGYKLRLDGIFGQDFAALMEHLYPLNDDPFALIRQNDWVSILKLSTEWKMLSVRATAMNTLESWVSLSPVDRIQLGKAYKIPEWVRSGYEDRIQHHEHLSELEVEKVGLEAAIKLSNILEDHYERDWDSYINRFSLDAHGASNLISNIFGQDVSDPTDMDDLVSQLICSRDHNNKASFFQACKKISERREGLNKEEIGRLGLDTAIRVWQARLETRKAAWSLTQTFVTSASNSPQLTAEEKIKIAFGEELMEVEEESRQFAQLRNPTPSAPIEFGSPIIVRPQAVSSTSITILPSPKDPSPAPLAAASPTPVSFGTQSFSGFGEPARVASPPQAFTLPTPASEPQPRTEPDAIRGIWKMRGGKAKK